MAPKIANFIIDISIYPEIYAKLAFEQKKLAEKHGDKITLSQLDEMVFLDASITESIRLAVGSGTVRKTNVDYILSNDILIKKDSFVKLNKFTCNRDCSIFEKIPFDFYPERHIFNHTKLSGCSRKNITWGFGGNICPAREYCATQMKLFAAIFIRKYEVSQGEKSGSTNHRGYNFRNTIQHANTSIHLKPHNILQYQSVFGNF